MDMNMKSAGGQGRKHKKRIVGKGKATTEVRVKRVGFSRVKSKRVSVTIPQRKEIARGALQFLTKRQKHVGSVGRDRANWEKKLFFWPGQ